jgi:hypothetical protein
MDARTCKFVLGYIKSLVADGQQNRQTKKIITKSANQCDRGDTNGDARRYPILVGLEIKSSG